MGNKVRGGCLKDETTLQKGCPFSLKTCRDLPARGVEEGHSRWRRWQDRGTDLVKNEIFVFRRQRGHAWAGHGMLVGK